MNTGATEKSLQIYILQLELWVSRFHRILPENKVTVKFTAKIKIPIQSTVHMSEV